MTTIETITHAEFGEIRTAKVDGEPWFVANDVCRVLDLVNPRKALADLDDDEKGVTTGDTPGGRQEMATVNEPGLYQLIFRSRKPEARAFRRWISHEVLPAIRKYGRYDPTAKRTEVLDAPVFEELPGRMFGTSSMWPPILTKVMERPGEWARVASTVDSKAASRTVQGLRSRSLRVPPGVWAFAARTADDGRGLVYARFLGAEPLAVEERCDEGHDHADGAHDGRVA